LHNELGRYTEWDYSTHNYSDCTPADLPPPAQSYPRSGSG